MKITERKARLHHDGVDGRASDNITSSYEKNTSIMTPFFRESLEGSVPAVSTTILVKKGSPKKRRRAQRTPRVPSAHLLAVGRHGHPARVAAGPDVRQVDA